MGNLNIIRKIPVETVQRDPIVNDLKESVMKFATRRMRNDFIQRDNKSVGSKVVLRNIYDFLTEFEYAPESEKEAAIDNRFCDSCLQVRTLILSLTSELTMVIRMTKNLIRFGMNWGGT